MYGSHDYIYVYICYNLTPPLIDLISIANYYLIELPFTLFPVSFAQPYPTNWKPVTVIRICT